MFGLNFAALPRAAVMYVPADGESVMFNEERLRFIAVSGDVFYFWARGSYYRFQLDGTTGTCEILESGAGYFRVWKSRDDASKFARWNNQLRSDGCDENTFSFIANSKFVDRTRTDLRGAGELVASIKIVGETVVFGGKSIVPKIVQMEGGALAVSLESDRSALWIYGSGGFQLNQYGAVEIAWVGDGKVPSGVVGLESTIDALVALYPRLKALAR